MAPSQPRRELRPVSTGGQYWQMKRSENAEILEDFERELTAIEAENFCTMLAWPKTTFNL